MLLSLNQNADTLSIDNLSTLPSHNQNNGIYIVCDAYRLNPMGTPADKEGYSKILNLAGHFE
ncbi:hypothetical protein CGJ37_22705 [Vibrio parahaemolyticus]|nr:hypothetical protein CGJ37_22705 [Vibrio parahaemolyticus]